ncbi:MAG: hypothetical protein RJA63_4139 [Pseudomonadota bacterium]|jgi:curli biogenesis system outer membrane secretion channel CsgG
MNTNFTHHIAMVLIAAATALAAGCASVAVSSDAIERNTASALGLERGSFTISDRVDDGVKTNYAVRTNAGKSYACYVTGTISVTGRVVSDAICSELGKTAKQATTPSTPASTSTAGTSCNALLRAAGRC